jgi:hypothetical protein
MSTQQHRSGPFPYSRATALPSRDVAPARPSRARKVVQGSRESGIVVFAIFMYFLIRGLMTTSVDRAFAHAYDLVDLEQALGIAWEADLQQWASGHPWLASAMNSIYIYGHWPVIAGTLGWLLWKRGDQFRVFRNAMVISGLIGFVFFVMYPMAPPRFLTDLGFVDTVMRDTSSYRVLQPPAFTNQYAAMPSLHVGWNLLMGVAIFLNARHWAWRAFAVAMPLAMYAATILTANHFVLDGVVGAAVALTGLAIARQVAKAKGAPDDELVHTGAGHRG